MKRKTSAELVKELEAPDDGGVSKPVGVWSLEKLATLMLYFRAFTRACGGGYYFDGFSGPGVCRVRNPATFPYLAWGSPMLALQTDPPFEKCIFVDLDERNVAALRRRITGHDNALLHAGDVNEVAASLIRTAVPSSAPVFCLLDQQGGELLWSTVEQIAAVPGRRRRPELLILFPLRMALLRLLSVQKPLLEKFSERWDLVFGHHDWFPIYRARLAGDITPVEAHRGYVDLYTAGLRGLGYAFVTSKVISAPRMVGRPRQEMYHLVFATDSDVGNKIMSHVFKRPYALDFVVSGRPRLFD